MCPVSALDENRVRTLVEAALATRQPRGYSLRVEVVLRQPDFWQVAVRPDRAGVRADEYAEVLTAAEEQLRDQQEVPVVLTPVLV